MPDAVTKFLMRDALRLAYDVWERPGSPAVLLLHGGGQTRGAWRDTGAALHARGYDVTVLDLRGHGDSGWADDGDYSYDAYADDVRALMATKAGPVVLIGASLGGIVSMVIAGADHDAKVAALVLVDIAPTQRPRGTSKIEAFMRASPEGFESPEEAADVIAAYLPHRPRGAASPSLMKNLRWRGDRLMWHWDPRILPPAEGDRSAKDERRLAAARSIRVPTLLVRGAESDVVMAEDVAAFRELISQGEVVEIAGARHMVAGDQNIAFTDAVLDFVGHTVPPTVASVRPH